MRAGYLREAIVLLERARQTEDTREATRDYIVRASHSGCCEHGNSDQCSRQKFGFSHFFSPFYSGCLTTKREFEPRYSGTRQPIFENGRSRPREHEAVCHPGAIHIPIPMITSDTTITNRSIVSHVGIRFARCWGMACPSAHGILCRKRASGCEYVHTPWGLMGWSTLS